MRTSTLTTILLLATPAVASAQEAATVEFFEKKVRPILVEHCLSCHGPKKVKGGLRLDTKAGFLKGGDSGPLVRGNDPEKSLLVQVIRYDGDIKMPQKGKLPEADIATLTAWVKGGAVWPDEGSGGSPAASGEGFDVHARAQAHWSFRPVRRPPVPDVGASRPDNPIDAFLLKKLQDRGLSFAPPADKRTLLRRVTFDLTGLPPTPEEIADFLKDGSPEAYERVVDRLLASPAYGERWGRHWLDLVRYAETHGHEYDFEIPDAWRYRDYVIRAFNADVPYDQFLREHIAGDLLPQPRRDPQTGVNESLTATGFWWLGEAKHSPVDSRAEQADRIDNQIDVFGKAVLGLTLSCARCHDHKFDPISTRDYYALFGTLTSSRYQRADIDDPAPVEKVLDEMLALRDDLKYDRGNGPVGRSAPPPAPPASWRQKADCFEDFGPGWRDRWDATGLGLRPRSVDAPPHTATESERLQAALRSPTFTIDKPFLAVRIAGKAAHAQVILNGLQLIRDPIYGGLRKGIDHGEELRWLVFDLRMWKGQRAYLELLDDGPGYFAVTDVWFADTPPPADKPHTVTPPPGPPAGGTEPPANWKKWQALEARLAPPRRAPAMRDGTGLNEHVFVRGNHKTLGPEVPRAFLEVFGHPPFTSRGSGRLELARAVTDPANPLVARVIVNRLWKHHFGEGLVRTPDDFGKQGRPPTHPELLDWLAAELVEQKWSLKRMHRLMLLSTAYRQSSRATPEQAAKAATADPLNELLHRQNVRRLEAEAIRDSLLAVSGRLDRTPGGPSILPYLTEHQAGRGKPPSGPLDGQGRRSIYLAVRRNFLNPLLTAFDYPTPFTTIGRRTVSNVPAQALVMLNNPFVVQQAEVWARRVLAVPGRTPPQRIAAMYEAAFARPPSDEELALAVAFVTEQAKEYGSPDAPKAWADLAHVLFNAKEFIFVE